MAYTTINKSTDNFRTKTYTGNSTNNTAITWDESANMKPDFLWLKNRTLAQEHWLCDVVRGANYFSESDTSNAQQDGTGGFDSFNTNGFTVDNTARTNRNTMVGWGWKAGGSQGSANTAGSINTTYTSVNTTAGFSISQYTGTGSNATVGHGLGAVPKMIIVKKLSGSDSWTIYHASLGATKKINFDTGAVGTQSDRWNDTSPTNTLFSIGTNGSVNANNATYVAYCFADKQGYSKFGSYVGTGNADGAFAYTGFKPAFVLFKRTDTAKDWILHDSKRTPFNSGVPKILKPNSNGTEAGTGEMDILSNGFKLLSTGTNSNESGGTYIYMAFGQSIVGTNNVPCTAK